MQEIQENQCPFSLSHLATMYLQGRGFIPETFEHAGTFLEKLANEGSITAQCSLVVLKFEMNMPAEASAYMASLFKKDQKEHALTLITFFSSWLVRAWNDRHYHNADHCIFLTISEVLNHITAREYEDAIDFTQYTNKEFAFIFESKELYVATRRILCAAFGNFSFSIKNYEDAFWYFSAQAAECEHSKVALEQMYYSHFSTSKTYCKNQIAFFTEMLNSIKNDEVKDTILCKRIKSSIHACDSNAALHYLEHATQTGGVNIELHFHKLKKLFLYANAIHNASPIEQKNLIYAYAHFLMTFFGKTSDDKESGWELPKKQGWKGHDKSACDAAQLYLTGIKEFDVTPCQEIAKNLCKASVKKGGPIAGYFFGKMVLQSPKYQKYAIENINTRPDVSKTSILGLAFQGLEIAAKNDSADACFLMANGYLKRLFSIYTCAEISVYTLKTDENTNLRLAENYLRKAVSLGHKEAEVTLYHLLSIRTWSWDSQAPFKTGVQEATEMPDPPAANPKGNPLQALFMPALVEAAQCFPDAIFQQGMLLSANDPNRTVLWERADQLGHPEVAFQRGLACLNGPGAWNATAKDLALVQFKIALRKYPQHTGAHFELAKIHDSRIGTWSIINNKELAIIYYNKVCELASPDSEEHIKASEALKRLSPSLLPMLDTDIAINPINESQRKKMDQTIETLYHL